MADIFDPQPTTLFCDESKDLCFDDLDDDDDTIPQNTNNQSRPCLNACRSEPLIHLSPQNDGGFDSMVERETEYLPREDYLRRLRCGELDLVSRREAFDWIWKAHFYHSFGPLTICLAVNYFDRFLSIRELPRDKTWAVQLLAVACLSIAAKVEETNVPLSIELQVGNPKFMFEAKTIQRMELLVLDTLNWKMNALTSCSFLDYSLRKLNNDHNNNNPLMTTKVLNRSMELILCTIRGIDFLEFRTSEISAAVAIFVSAEIQALDIDKAISCFIHLDKGRILKCLQLIKDMSVISRSANMGIISGQAVPQSPIGVLDAACFSCKSDELTTLGSFGNSSQNSTTSSPETKRKKLDLTSTSGLDL